MAHISLDESARVSERDARVRGGESASGCKRIKKVDLFVALTAFSHHCATFFLFYCYCCCNFRFHFFCCCHSAKLNT